MNLHLSVFRRAISGSLVFAALSLGVAGMNAGCTSSGNRTEASDAVPDNIRAAGPVIARVHATGFQVYTCTADATGQLAWTLKAPDATFESDKGLKGRHYAGPTWESTVDASKVVGKKIADHASPDADAIPWLLLSAASHTGDGIFSNVTYIQRIHTTGGKAPPVGTAKPGDILPIAYTAVYVFYGPGTTTQPAKP